jgi:hypothetical protein
MDFGFLNKQVDKITNTDELSVLFFKLKKLQLNKHKEMIRMREKYEEMDKKMSTIMEKIVIRIVETIDMKEDEEDSTSEEEEEEEEEEQLKSGDIELLSDSDDE